MEKIICCVIGLIPYSLLWCQSDTTYQEKYQSEYQVRIKQSHINGFYIPKDIDDAMAELDRIVDQHGKERFRAQEEEVAVRKIHFSFGRWMIHNWGFYEGSRLSHYLKGLGITYPDDMASTLMLCYHRKLNDKPMRVEEIAEYFAEKRRKEMEDRINRGQILEVHKVEKN